MILDKNIDTTNYGTEHSFILKESVTVNIWNAWNIAVRYFSIKGTLSDIWN